MSESTLSVKDIIWHSDAVFELRLARPEFSFCPGDCVALYHGEASRPYSVASGVDDDYLGFIIRRMPGGEVSDYLAGLAPGSPVRLSPPFGWFRPGDPGLEAPCVFFATGTGISPFMSHFRSRPEAPPERLLYGVREAADAVALRWLREQSEVSFAVSREPCDGAHHGRITELLDEVSVRPEVHYFLCGLDDMIDEVSTWLEGQGVALPHIHRECFFNAHYDV